MKKYKIVEANDVTYNLTFLKPKFEVKRFTRQKLLNLVTLVRHYKNDFTILAMHSRFIGCLLLEKSIIN
jgi:hypothetical protein